MEIAEKTGNKEIDLVMLERLLSLDLNSESSVPLTNDEEQELFGLLQTRGLGKAITNLAEYLLLTQAMKGEIAMSAFWFRLGLKYYERVEPESIERHLIMLALFYASRDKRMMAEGLYRQVLEKLNYEKHNSVTSYNLVMALNFYGRMLLSIDRRQAEAQTYLKQSEQIAKDLPYWYDRLDNLYMPKFDLD